MLTMVDGVSCQPEQLRNAEGLQVEAIDGRYGDPKASDNRRSILEEPHHRLATGGTS
jgi:hypothetical protein